jgi:hypothetical protein
MAENSLAKLPQELKDHIGRYLDLRSIARARLASNKFNFFLLSERAKLEKHTRAWVTVFGSVSDNKNLLNSVARLHGGRVDNWDIILPGSDLEYLYHADDVGKKLPQDYGPLHLWLRAIQRGFEASYDVPCDLLKRERSVQMGKQHIPIILHTSGKFDDLTISDVYNLGITKTWAVFYKLNLN